MPVLLLLALAVAAPLPATGQLPGSGDSAGGGAVEGDWNDSTVLALVARGREARRDLAVEGDLETYRALTEGHIYFFVDPEEGEEALIRVDQVAVRLLWQAPDHVHQRVVGERSERRLPVRDFNYYLDRLTLVQYGFGDEIEVGSGMDVAGVPHPLAPLPGGDPARGPYDFRIVDALTLTLPGEPEPVRMLEVEVRPRDPEAPGILGTLLLERDTGSIVRMAFGFTPASYVDRRTDRISVEVDYGLWEGRYWLPNRQEIEVRRELPELDLGVGTVIRAVLRVGEYELNAPLGRDLTELPSVLWAPEAEREAYPFREGLLAGLERDGLEEIRTRVDPREVRARAAELLRNRPPSGLARLRLHLPRASSALRYNRAEGLFLGLGGTFEPTARLRLRAHGGYGFGMGRAAGSLRLDGLWGDGASWELRGSANELGDLGLVPAADPLLSAAGGAFLGEDYLDPYRTSELRGVVELGERGPWRLRVGGGVRRDRSHSLTAQAAPLADDRSFRPVREVAAGDFVTGRVDLRREVDWPAGGAGEGTLALKGVAGDAGSGGSVEGEVRSRWANPLGSRELDARLVARSWIGDALPQGHRLLGGRGSVPGYPFRAWAGRDLALASLEAATDLHGPLLRLRAGLHAGWTGRADPAVLESWDAAESRGIRPAVTVGVGLGWDLLRIEAARGLRGGEWQLLLSVDPRWWSRL